MKINRKEIFKVMVSLIILTFFFAGCTSLLESIQENPKLAVKLIEVRFYDDVTKEEIEKVKKDFHLKFIGKVQFSDDRYVMLIEKIPRGSSVEEIIAQLKDLRYIIMSADTFDKVTN